MDIYVIVLKRQEARKLLKYNNMNTLDKKKELNEYKPKRDLELFCYALISPDVKGNKDKAQQISGIDKGKFYWAWHNHPEFREWFSQLCFSVLKTNEAIPHT